MERIEVEAARSLVLGAVAAIEDAERVKLDEALKRVTAEDIHAPIDSAPFDCSPLDGFAFHSDDSSPATVESPVRLRVVGAVYAGTVFTRALMTGEAVRIMTGAAMPEGADCMAPKEAVQDDGASVLLSRPVKHHENFMFRGEDIKKGQLLIAKGQKLDFARLTALAATGFGSVSVLRSPKIGLLCTGDELSPPDTPLLPGKIYNSNETMIGCRLRELGFPPQVIPIMGDDPAAVTKRIADSLEECDMLLTTGAVSVGDKDIMHEVLAALGAKRLFGRLNSKPGGSILCAAYKNKLIGCLPGYPFAAITMFELLIRPALAKLATRDDLYLERRKAVLKNGFAKKPGDLRRFLRAKLEYSDSSPGGEVSLPDAHASAQIFSLAGCNCLIDATGDDSLEPGSIVSVIML